MSAEENKAVVRRLVEEDLNTDNRDSADTIVAEDFVDHTNPEGLKHGLDSHKKIVEMFRAAFPDARWTIEELFAEGDKVIAHLPMRATHLGDFFGIPASGKEVFYDGYHMLRVANGKVAEHWGVSDDIGLMRQLGAIPS